MAENETTTPPQQTETKPTTVVPPAGGAKPAGEVKAPPIEQPKLPASVRPTGDPKETPEFKAFLSKEAEFVKNQNAFKVDRENFEKERGEYSKLKTLFTEGKTNPMKLLEGMGLTPDQFAEAMAKGGPTADLMVKAMGDRIAGIEQKFQTQEQQAAQAAEAKRKQEADGEVQRYVGEVSAHLGKSVEKYPTLVGLNQGGLVAQKVLTHYEQTGKELSIDDAAAEVEKDLAGRFPDMVKPMLAIKPMRELLKKLLAQADGVKPKEEPKDAITIVRPQPKTLDNSMTGTEVGGSTKLPDDPRDAWDAIKERRKAAKQ